MKMKKYVFIPLVGLLVFSCKKGTQNNSNSNAHTTQSAPSPPANVAALCGTWMLDSTTLFEVNFPHTGDTTRNMVTLCSNPATCTLTLTSTPYTLTVNNEVIMGYESFGSNPGGSGYNPCVWKLKGDTIYFPTTNQPLTSCGITHFFTPDVLTAHKMVLCDRSYYSAQHVNQAMNKYYYHK